MIISKLLGRLGLSTICLLLVSAQTLLAFTKAGTTYTTDGSQADVSAAIAVATTGDTVAIPAGTFTWGVGGALVAVNKQITLSGAGRDSTTITVSNQGPQWGTGVIAISAAAVVKSFTITQIGGAPTSAFSTSTTDGWRITDVVYNSPSSAGYAVYAGTYGLIDNCVFNGGSGSDELIFSRGPDNSWQTPSTLGSASAVYVENNTFTGPAYVCDFNSNARGVVRFNTISGMAKIDAHGKASNGPPRSFRHIEVYDNRWTNTNQYWTAMEIRGATSMLFDNVYEGTGVVWFMLKEYGCDATWPNFNYTYQTPFNYPIDDQVGVGVDPKVAGSEPAYLWNNRSGGLDWQMNFYDNIPAGATSLYQQQTGNPNATFTQQDIIAADRDYFRQGATFDGTSGVGRGTVAQMRAITPTKVGVGFWVTDEGKWNSLTTGPDGHLYKWDGSQWVVSYTPYTYPHPLTGNSVPAPAVSGQVVEAESVSIQAPFVVGTNNGRSYVFQSTATDMSDGGRLAFSFTTSVGGEYAVVATVNAPSSGPNAFFVNIDAEPSGPDMTWDVLPATTNFESRTVGWRGNSTSGADQYSPKYFTLSADTHTLIIRGSSANTQIDNIKIVKRPSAPSNLRRSQ